MPLADLQRTFRTALVTGDATPLLPALRGPGGRSPSARLAIYLRHYEASLVDALMQRFPATAWLIGSPALQTAAHRYVRHHPPHAPCIAEYGEGLPALLDGQPVARGLPVADFARLDWALGRLSVGVEEPALAVDAAASLGPDLPQYRMHLQSATWYGCSDAPIDELITRYLNDAEDGSPLTQGRVWLEARGNRGALRISRLSPAAFAFRQGLARGLSLESAAAAAAHVDGDFDAGAALAALFQDGLVTGLMPSHGDDV